MKKLLLVLVLFMLMGCDLTTSSETTTQMQETTSTFETTSYIQTVTYEERNYSEFESLYINDSNLQLSQEEETYYIYYYGLFCDVCCGIKNEVLSKIELLENDKVYLVDVVNSSDIHEDIDVQYVPSLVKVTEGVAVDIYVGAVSIMNIINGLD